MILRKKYFVLIFMMILLSTFVSAQYYDYHRDESPAISWNDIPIFDARMMATGGISLMASNAFSAAINPAAIPPLEGILTGTSFQTMKHQAFQYRGLNQGAYYDPNNQSQKNNRFSGFTFSFPLKNFRLAAGWYTARLPQLPSINFDQEYWALSGTFPGIENTFFAAAAFKWGKTIDVGFKLDYISGKRETDITETWKDYPLTMQHRENHKLTYLVPSIGTTIKISPRWTLGAVVIYPLRGKARRTMDRIFQSDYERLEISGLKSTDDLYRPPRVYVGTTFTPFINRGKTRLTLAAEMLYAFWSGYKYVFYEETLPRDMKNTLVLALGMELGLLRDKTGLFFRLGYRLDPQPVTQPQTTLHALTGGVGIRLGKISLDIGGMYYSGSPGGISQKHFVLNSTLQVHLKGGNQ
ncbi:MAG: hypothetical protein GY950_00365 [bacterium]|nr:hypothetical protein [bacterium]